MRVPFLDLSRSHRVLREEILGALAATYDANRFCLGEDVEGFERDFARVSGLPDAVGVSNGTAALHLCARALEVGGGDEVIVPAFTFIASAWTASHVGARPVFADIDPDTYLIDPASVAGAITERTRAIVAVHLFGSPAPMDALNSLARARGLAVIEDCAQAHLARCGGRPVGGLGDMGVFSFYPTKNLGGCGEGGAVVSRRPEALERVRALRTHGSTVRYRHDEIGYNYRMDGFQAAALRVKLRDLESGIARRREIARRYREGLRLTDLRLPGESPDGESVYHQFTVKHPRRDALRQHLTGCGVGTDLIYPIPLHLQPCYRQIGPSEGALPGAESAARTCLSLPIFPELTDEEVDYVVRSVNAF